MDQPEPYRLNDQPASHRRPCAHRRSGVLSGVLAFTLLLSLACQVIPTPPPLRSTPILWATPEDAGTPILPSQTPPPTPFAPPARQPTLAPGDLPAFPSNLNQPFASIGLVTWSPGSLPLQADVPLPARLAQLANPQVVAGLTMRQRAQLYQQGFLILHTQEANFMQVRERVSLQYGQPYYLTVDAASHALHLALNGLQQALERQELQRRLFAVVQATLNEILAALPQVQGGPLEADTRLAAAYLGVALRLLDPQVPLDPAIAEPVQTQVQQILAGEGQRPIYLLPDQEEDFRAYQPYGYYATDPVLAGYFRATRWLSRITFPLYATAQSPNLSQAPLIITLALRRASVPAPAGAGMASSPTTQGAAMESTPAPTGSPATQASTPALEEWARLHQAITFFNGSDFIGGPPELASLMDQVYGRQATLLSLGNNAQNETFRQLAAELPPPHTVPGLPIVAGSGQGLEGWRFLGQGFHLDEFVLDSLADPRSGQAWPPERLHSGLDVLDVLGAPAARQALEAQGFSPPADQRLQNAIQQQDDGDWLSTRQRAWLHVVAAHTGQRGEAFPMAMRSPAWATRSLSSALGIWASLRQEPVALPHAVESPAAGTAAVSPAAPGYVEPDPDAFYRMARLAHASVEGLRQRGMNGIFSPNPDPQGLERMLQDTLDLGDRLQRLGDIAAGELAGKIPGPDEWSTIQAPLGPAEARAAGSPYRAEALPPLPGVTTLTIPGRPMVQVATGGADRLYVLVPSGDRIAIAQGAIYSYYEFSPPNGRLLDNSTWHQTLVEGKLAPPAWAVDLYLPEGYPVDVLAFQIGDVYRVTPAAGRLNVRQEANRFSTLVRQLNAGDLLTIIDGPRRSSGQTWWGVQVETPGGAPVTGWVVQDPAWYARVY